MRRALTWLLLVPLALLGSEAAHATNFWLVAPDSGERSALLTQTGHAYMGWLPAVIAVCWAVVLLSLLGWALEGGRGRRAPVLPFTPFALLPPIAFAGRELVERATYGDLQPAALVEPVFLPYSPSRPSRRTGAVRSSAGSGSRTPRRRRPK